MPAIDCIIQHGTLEDIDCPVDEPNILVNSLTISAAREKKEYKKGEGCIGALRFTNPTLSFAFDGFIQALGGLTDQHPGTAVISLANYQQDTFGFDPDDGVMVYEDPSRECSNEELAQAKFNVVQYPFVA